MLALERANGAEAALQISPNAQQSQWTDYGSLATWGYDFGEWDMYIDFKISRPIASALQALGLSTESVDNGGDNVLRMFQHENDVTVDGVFYKVSLGMTSSCYNV